MTLNIGSLLQGGKYKIEKVLGQGGFGITYLAEQTMLERKVAIKEFFMKEFCERDESTSHVTMGTAGARETVERFRDKFLKEARNIAKLKHPHIIQILDVFEENATAYYVMEYAENGSLLTLVADNKPLPEAQATRYILQVADALAYIHERKMNHLDIKPGNIMLNEKDEAVLIDFGLSKQYDDVGQQTSTTPVGMSEGYAPMEQYGKGGMKEFSPETDIYAMGATFFKLLTGVTPPGASEVNEGRLPVKLLKSKGISQKAIDVICKTMEPLRKNRMSDVREFKKFLTTQKTEYGENNNIVECKDDETIVNVETKNTEVDPNEKKYGKSTSNKTSGTERKTTVVLKNKWIDVNQFLEGKVYKNRRGILYALMSIFLICLIGILIMLCFKYSMYGDIMFHSDNEDLILGIFAAFGLYSVMFLILFLLSHSPIIGEIYNIEDGSKEDKFRPVQNSQGKCGLCEIGYSKLKCLLPFQYDLVCRAKEDSFICRQGQKYGMYNTKLKKMVLPVVYDGIYSMDEGVIKVVKNGEIYSFSYKGFRIID